MNDHRIPRLFSIRSGCRLITRVLGKVIIVSTFAFIGSLAAVRGEVPLNDNLVWLQGARKSLSVTIPGTTQTSSLQESEGVQVGNRLYEIGGQISPPNYTCTRNVSYYDFVANKWVVLPDLTRGISHAGFGVDGNTIWVVGGYVERDPTMPNSGKTYSTTQVLKLDTTTNTWSTGPDLPIERAAGLAVVLGRKLHFVGGSSKFRNDPGDPDYVPGPNEQGNQPYNSTKKANVFASPNHWTLDLDHESAGWTQVAELAVARNHVGGVALKGKVWLVAGQQRFDEQAAHYTRVDAYDPATDSWSQPPVLTPPGRSHCYSGTFVADDRIIILGGLPSSGNLVSCFDSVKNVWYGLPPMPDNRTFSVAGWFNDSTIVVGGSQAATLLGVNLIPPGAASVAGATVQWKDNSSNETGFQIERRCGGTGEWNVVGSVGANVTKWTDPAQVQGLAYTYRVRAIIKQSNGASGQSRPGSHDAPVNLRAQVGGTNNTSVSLTWNASSGAHKYTVRRSTMNGQFHASTPWNASSQSYTDTISPGQLYYYVVTSSDVNGLESEYSAVVTANVPSGNTDGIPDAWRYQYFGSATITAGKSGALNSPAHDGISNLLKYATGLSPLVTAVSPAGDMHLNETTKRAVLTFNRLDPATLTYTVQASDDLKTWQSIATLVPNSESWTGTATVSDAGAGNGPIHAVTVTDPQLASQNPRRFLRLSISAP